MKNTIQLICKLARNDFKQKFAGSFLGVIWAFVQPVVTVLVYWVVFEKALNVGAQGTKEGISAPFVIWLCAGIVPWFYFSEVMNSGSNCLYDYSFLVKKVVFQIRTLPVVKVVSSLFVHLFFVIFTIVLLLCYGYKPSLYWLQIFYYLLAMMVLTVGFIYITSALAVFFRDILQIVNIILSVGIWATPIMWNFDALSATMPNWLSILLRLNPMYYITSGYRNSLIYAKGFWEFPGLSLYYWIFTFVILFIGIKLFKKLQPQFADVL